MSVAFSSTHVSDVGRQISSQDVLGNWQYSSDGSEKIIFRKNLTTCAVTVQ